MRTPFDPRPAPVQPSADTDLRPDARPDANLPPDTRPDTRIPAPPLEADASPDLPIKPLPDARPDQKIERPDVPLDLGSDRRPTTPDLPPDLKPDLRPDLRPDTPPEAALPPGGCTAGSLSPCTCDHGPDGLRFCLPSLVFGECMCGMDAATRVRIAMLGDWSGTATNPWSGTYPVLFTFDNTSHYSCRSLDPQWKALYYGTDEDSPDKTYSTSGVNSDGSVSGTLTVVFEAGTTVENKLENIVVSADLNNLKFSFKHFGETGPFQYDLQRLHW